MMQLSNEKHATNAINIKCDYGTPAVESIKNFANEFEDRYNKYVRR